MRRLLVVLLTVLIGWLGGVELAYATSPGGPGAPTSFQLALDSWPVILAGLCGVGATHLTEVLTHYEAPQWIKSGTNLVLTSLAGVLITVQVVPHHTWKDYVGEIFVAEVTALLTHGTGLTAWLQSIAGNVGYGAHVAPLFKPKPIAEHPKTRRRKKT